MELCKRSDLLTPAQVNILVTDQIRQGSLILRPFRRYEETTTSIKCPRLRYSWLWCVFSVNESTSRTFCHEGLGLVRTRIFEKRVCNYPLSRYNSISSRRVAWMTAVRKRFVPQPIKPCHAKYDQALRPSSAGCLPFVSGVFSARGGRAETSGYHLSAYGIQGKSPWYRSPATTV